MQNAVNYNVLVNTNTTIFSIPSPFIVASQKSSRIDPFPPAYSVLNLQEVCLTDMVIFSPTLSLVSFFFHPSTLSQADASLKIAL